MSQIKSNHGVVELQGLPDELITEYKCISQVLYGVLSEITDPDKVESIMLTIMRDGIEEAKNEKRKTKL